MLGILQKFRKDNAGVTAIEYALLGVLIAVAIIAAATTLGGQIATTFETISDRLSSVETGGAGGAAGE